MLRCRAHPIRRPDGVTDSAGLHTSIGALLTITWRRNDNQSTFAGYGPDAGRSNAASRVSGSYESSCLAPLM
jgi:hypothetical protein